MFVFYNSSAENAKIVRQIAIRKEKFRLLSVVQSAIKSWKGRSLGTVGISIAHLDQGWTMRRWMIVSRRRARGRPRAPGWNGTASGGENPGLVAEQHFPDYLRTLADHRRPSEPLYRATRSRDPRSTPNLVFPPTVPLQSSRSLTQRWFTRALV